MLNIKPKQGYKQIKTMCDTYNIVFIPEKNNKSQQKQMRLFTETFYNQKQKLNRQKIIPRFNERLKYLEEYLNNNNGVISVIEARKYLNINNSKTFTRLTDNLIKNNKIKIIHYNVNDSNNLNKVKTHTIILDYKLNAHDKNIIKYVKQA
eukprot:123945_1